jgi:hypothetical protein
MAEDRLKQKKKAAIYIGVLLALLMLLGFFVYLFNRAARLHTQIRHPIANPLEIFVILVGLALVSMVGVYLLSTLWKGQPKSFAYDIGVRVVVMGYLVDFTSGLADYIGIGAHHKLPYFGPLQTAGVFGGEVLIAIGFLLMLPWVKNKI